MKTSAQRSPSPLSSAQRPSLLKRIRRVALLSSLAFGFAGCQFDQATIDSWTELDDKGAARLGGYVIDPERPDDIRMRAFEHLVEMKKFDHLLSVLDQLPVEDRTMFSNVAVGVAQKNSRAEATSEQQANAVDLMFFMMSFDWGEETFKIQTQLMEWMTKWSLAMIKTGQTAMTTTNPDRALTVAVLMGGDQVLNIIQEQLEESVADSKTIVGIDNVLRNLKDPKIDEMLAKALLKTARTVYPENLTTPLVDAMIKNGNCTLLRFLLEVAKDNLAPMSVQEFAMEQASTSLVAMSQDDDTLRAEAADNFMRILSSSTASAPIIFYSIRQLWRLGGVELLPDTLKAINPNFRVPVAGTELRLDVEDFCNGYVVSAKDEARSTLLGLLDELQTKPELWPARLYALSCVHALYPDDFPRFMKKKGRYKKYFRRDKTPIRAWRSDGNTTLGEIAQELMNPLAR